MKKALIALAIALFVLLAHTPSVGQDKGAYRICRIVNQPMLRVDIVRKESDTTYFIGGRLITCGDSLFRVTGVRININTADSANPAGAVSELLPLSNQMLMPNADTTCAADIYVAPIHGGLLRRLLSYPSMITIVGEEDHTVNITLFDENTRLKIAQTLNIEGLQAR